MIAMTDPTAALLARLETLARQHLSAKPEWFTPLREAALDAFTRLGFPTTRDEDWRFTNLSALTATPFELPGRWANPSADQLAPFAVPGLKGCTLVFVNGHYAPALSNLTTLDRGVCVLPLAEAMKSNRALVEAHLTKLANFDDKFFTALNTAFIGDGVFIHAPRGRVVEQPIHLVNIAMPAETPFMTHPRNLIVAEENSQLQVIEHYVSLGEGAYLTNAVTEMFVGDNAHAAHYMIEEESTQAFNVSSLHARIGRSAGLDSHTVLLGGALVRNDIEPVLAGKAGHCLINGLFVGSGSQLLDNCMRVEHREPHCESHQFYNGVLNDQSHGVFTGRIYVDRKAQKTDAKQTSANLLLSDDAQIDTRPQLEIYADDVKCTHGATVGQIDEDALFYLRCRGIGEHAARAMMIFAFAAETFGRMKLEPIRDMLEKKLLSRLPEGEFLATVL